MKTVTIDGLEWEHDERRDRYERVFGVASVWVRSEAGGWFFGFNGLDGIDFTFQINNTRDEACALAVKTLKDIKALAGRIEV